jgi:hypothetical protein
MGKISTAGVHRLRATSAVARDKSVGRSAQDDVFVASRRYERPALFSNFYRLTFMRMPVPTGLSPVDLSSHANFLARPFQH